MSGDLSSWVAQVSWEVLSITDSEVINGITVPPEPDPVLNDATLTGVDINGNWVRDDVERVLVEKFGTKPNYQSFFDYAKAEQDLIVSGSEGSIKNYITMVECKDFPAKEANIITYKTLNNKIRNQKYGNLLAWMVLESCNK